ncbi:class I SAM-dependent methyltransferase [uncultured Selenomonas sp.]|uniref:class I SAM-dependent methyltransferase n=1 Tax=uncultured Selenomonas sp. TaxID=159275 RepID=UPI0028DCF0C3|nr:class I SAM-dependent methyltransferase [uncultured Selenomonas sp.]
MSHWQEIWNKRNSHLMDVDRTDKRAMLLELKRINGFDITKEGALYEAFLEKYEAAKEGLALPEGGSVFEVGCGAGANLWLFQQDGFRVGGIDFSEGLLAISRDVLREDALCEIVCGEACDLPQEEKYDAAFSDGVFHYFPDEAYAEKVLEGMAEKVRGNIVILDVHDAAKKEEFFAFRRKLDPDYDERYRGLDKLFYDKAFFEAFAKKHGFAVSFSSLTLEGYWNAPFVYAVFFSRQAKA